MGPSGGSAWSRSSARRARRGPPIASSATRSTDGRPVVAWVDMAELGTRGYPAEYRGGAYHVVVVRSLDDTRGVAVLDDLADQPGRGAHRDPRPRTVPHREVPQPPAAPAGRRPPADGRSGRARPPQPASRLMRSTGFDHPRTRNFGLDALADWSARLRGTGKDELGDRVPTRPSAVGRPGVDPPVHGALRQRRRPPAAAGRGRAPRRRRCDSATPGSPRSAARYEDLAARWTEPRPVGPPRDVPALRRTRELQDRRATALRRARPGGGGRDRRDLGGARRPSRPP